MRKILKSVLAVVLSATTAFGGLCSAGSLSAQEIENKDQICEKNMDASVAGTDSVGYLLADSVTDKLDEQQANDGYNIFSIEMKEKTAYVEFETRKDCTLVVGIYDESGVQMTASGSLQVAAGEKAAQVEIDVEAMPQYFLVRGYLVDSESFQPLCTEYESPNYTKEIQEFLAKTTDDFDEEKVVNFDEDTANNFAVFSDTTIVIPKTENSNYVVSADDRQSTYIIDNISTEIRNLKHGDTFAYPYKEGELLIVKVESIDINGTTATITGMDVSMEDVFEYIRIDKEAGTKEAQLDTSVCGEEVEYKGMTEHSEDMSSVCGLELVGSYKDTWSFDFVEEKKGNDNNNVKLTGGLELSLEFSLKFYFSYSQKYLELKISYGLSAAMGIEGKCKKEIPLAIVEIPLFTGVVIITDLNFVLEADAEVSLEASVSGSAGFSISGEGVKNCTRSPEVKLGELSGEFTGLIGVQLVPRIVIINENIAEVEVSQTVGAEIKAETADDLVGRKPDGTLNITEEKNRVHLCEMCLKGDIFGKVEFGVKVSMLKMKNLTYENHKLIALKTDAWRFYCSINGAGLNGIELKEGSCPHYMYKTIVNVEDKDGNPVTGAQVTIEDSVTTTNDNGEACFLLKNGAETGSDDRIKEYQVKVLHEDYYSETKTIRVKNNMQIIDVVLEEKDKAAMISNGGEYACFGIVTKRGDLYTGGSNYMAQLGRAGYGQDFYDEIEFRKIMDNVAQVSIGKTQSAAVTKDGKLYIWGYKAYMWLPDADTGNGLMEGYQRTPIKNMDNVSEISLGDEHSAAITKDGELYIWGKNNYGQVGNGTTTDQYSPQKVMDNVSEVSLGYDHSAAVTKDGELYMWGNNQSGQVGNGTTTGQQTPIKIMDNVSKVSLGWWYSAAITKDGRLYMWGKNLNGQVGNGTTTNQYSPQKVMDNVSDVGLGFCKSAAITKNGNIYIWGIDMPDGAWETFESDWEGSLRDYYINLTGKDMTIPQKIDLSFLERGRASVSGTSDIMSDSITVESPQSVKDDVSKDVVKRCTFQNLKPDAAYNFYIMRNKDADNPFSSDNLLYIRQVAADENGTCSIEYGTGQSCANAEMFVVEMFKTNMAGDLDGDGKIQLSDAQIALKAALRIIVLDADKVNAADVNHNYEVDLQDAQLILKYALKIINEF